MTALQVVDGQDIVIVFNDGDAAGSELAFENAGPGRVHVICQIGGIYMLTARDA